MQDLFTQAFSAQQNKKPIKASRLFREILKTDPNNPDALHGLGLCYAQRQQYNQSIKWIEKSISHAPNTPGFHNNLGNAYSKINNTALALRHYREALRLKTPYADAQNNLGALLFKLGKITEAIDALERALQSSPEKIDTHYNLACCYVKQDRFQDALTHYLIVLKKMPHHLGALHNAGILLTELKRHPEAKLFLSEALTQEPNNIDILFHLAIVYSIEGEYDKAKTLYEKIIQLHVQHAPAWHNLATVLLHLNCREQALNCFKKAFDLQPENFTAKHMIDALLGNPETRHSPPAFIQALFDQYAYNYNAHVCTQLKYQVPHLIRESLTPYIINHSLIEHTLDLGCGTGLMAPYLLDLTVRLTGVDLSENMISIAKNLNAYYKLYHDNILHFLPKHVNTFDLIVAADVFCYFGDLKEALLYCQRALIHNSLMIFTVESLDSLPSSNKISKPYRLQPSGRFAHSLSYIENLLHDINFKIKTHKQIILRYQEDIPVEGGMFLVQKVNF